MKDTFAQHDVRVVALSKDTVEQAAHHRDRDGLTLQLLADPKLKVIERFGLLHHKSVEFGISFSVLGVPMGLPTGSKTMAIPTSILIDEHGVIRWIDQAEDYRIRGDERRVTDALAEAFG